MNKLHISEYNIKLGRIPSVSLPPLVTCVPDPPCAKLCYARKAYEGYARHTCKPAWDDNLAYYLSDSLSFFNEIIARLERNRAPYFRWHVSGDIVDENYYYEIRRVALELPETNFLAYTRITDFASNIEDIEKVPNLRIIRSYWLSEDIDVTKPDWSNTRTLLLHPWFQVLPKNSLHTCAGSCADCHVCWYLLPSEGRSISLH